MKRRNFLVAAGAAFVAGCNKVAESAPGAKLLSAAESWHKTAHRFLTDREALAPEYPRSAISPYFRGNGSTDPKNGDYQAQAASDFADWRPRRKPAQPDARQYPPPAPAHPGDAPRLR